MSSSVNCHILKTLIQIVRENQVETPQMHRAVIALGAFR